VATRLRVDAPEDERDDVAGADGIARAAEDDAGTANPGKRGTGKGSVGNGDLTLGASMAARTDAVIKAAYGDASAIAAMMPNQNRCRRDPRLLSPNLIATPEPCGPAANGTLLSTNAPQPACSPSVEIRPQSRGMRREGPSGRFHCPRWCTVADPGVIVKYLIRTRQMFCLRTRARGYT
jgi:hypothetical protein